MYLNNKQGFLKGKNAKTIENQIVAKRDKTLKKQKQRKKTKRKIPRRRNFVTI